MARHQGFQSTTRRMDGPAAPAPARRVDLTQEIQETRARMADALDAIGRVASAPGPDTAAPLSSAAWLQRDDLLGAAAATFVAARHVVPLVRATFSRKALLGAAIVALGAATVGVLAAGRIAAKRPRHGRSHAAR